MISHDAAAAIREELLYSTVYLKSELSIEFENDSDALILGLFISSSIDLNEKQMLTFA